MQYLTHLIEPFPEELLSDNWALSNNFFYTEKRNLNFADLDKYSLFILGISLSADKSGFHQLRKELYSLSLLKEFLFCDLGNIKSGYNIDETKNAFSFLYQDIVSKGKTILILSDEAEIATLHLSSIQKINAERQITIIDKKLNILENSSSMKQGYIGKFLDKTGKKIHFSAVGTQEYFIQEEEKEIIQKQFHTELRLGKIKENIQFAEPALRNSKIINFNLASIQYPYIKGNDNSPNGLDSREACIISNFCGQADFLESLAVYPIDEKNENNAIELKLIAQIIWYFLKSFAQKIIEIPNAHDISFTKFVVNYTSKNTIISFLKSNITNRWWTEIVYKKEKTTYFPSSYDEYLSVKNDHIPDEWIKYLDKINQSKKKK